MNVVVLCGQNSGRLGVSLIVCYNAFQMVKEFHNAIIVVTRLVNCHITVENVRKFSRLHQLLHSTQRLNTQNIAPWSVKH